MGNFLNAYTFWKENEIGLGHGFKFFNKLYIIEYRCKDLFIHPTSKSTIIEYLLNIRHYYRHQAITVGKNQAVNENSQNPCFLEIYIWVGETFKFFFYKYRV